MQLKNVCVRTLGSPAMPLNGFSVLLLVPPEPERSAEIKRTICTVLCPPIFRLEFSHNAIENKVYYDLATT